MGEFYMHCEIYCAHENHPLRFHLFRSPHGILSSLPGHPLQPPRPSSPVLPGLPGLLVLPGMARSVLAGVIRVCAGCSGLAWVSRWAGLPFIAPPCTGPLDTRTGSVLQCGHRLTTTRRYI